MLNQKERKDKNSGLHKNCYPDLNLFINPRPTQKKSENRVYRLFILNSHYSRTQLHLKRGLHSVCTKWFIFSTIYRSFLFFVNDFLQMCWVLIWKKNLVHICRTERACGLHGGVWVCTCSLMHSWVILTSTTVFFNNS